MDDSSVEIDSMKAWFLAARPKTLTCAAVPVMIGATLAMAETLAGAGSYCLCPEALACVGQNVHGNHIHPAKEGETVTATAQIIHKGKNSHIWQVDVRNDDGQLISSISVTNYIIYRQ